MDGELIKITQEKLDQLNAEMHELKFVHRPQIAERVQSARELGDLKENAEYHTARDDQGRNESRIEEIDYILKHYEIIEKSGSDTAELTSVVVVKKDGDDTERTFTLVSSTEADMATGKLSVDSPIGLALLGKAAGEVAEVITPGGSVKWNVISVT